MPEDLGNLTLRDLRTRFMAEHACAQRALEHGNYNAFKAAIDREQPFIAELVRRIDASRRDCPPAAMLK